MSILVIAEHDNNVIKPATLNAVTAACQLGEEVVVLVAGHNSAAAAAAAASIAGVSKVSHVENPLYEHVLAEEIAPLVVSLASNVSHILAPASTFGKNIIPRVAALLDVGAITDISKIESADTFVRPIYAGNAMATVQSNDSIKVMTIRSTAFDAAATEGGTASVEVVEAAASLGLSSFVRQELTKSERPELTSAKIIISGGRGFGSEENFGLLDEVADKLGAAIGASRAAVDAGYAPNDYQVGQTGKIVAPDLYIAVGISGAIQHLAGMKDSKVIVAINKDEEAPIFEISDYGLVADLFQVLPELSAALDELS
ncbi:MAG: electron transfer flavoprotein alpha subunit [Gammaproteobacteria bacterium]|jgi:electron transfer flavoprotein alpha subunit